MKTGIVLVSHVKEIGEGIQRLIQEVAKDVPITVAAGTEAGEIGTSFDQVLAAVEHNVADDLFAFYDLGSAKMNLEMVQEITSKKLEICDTAFVESAYTAAALLQSGATHEKVREQISKMKIKENN